MKVYDVLTESEQKTDEGPVRFLKRTLGKNTKFGKAAQVDFEIDKEVKSMMKDYYALVKNSPDAKKGYTIGSLAKFLKQKGFVADPKSVLKYYQDNPSLGKKLAKAGAAGAAAAAAGGKKVAGAAKKGAAAVGKAASNLKKKVSPSKSPLTPEPAQGELDLKNSIYGEALEAYALAMEAGRVDPNTPLETGEVKIVMKKFVQQGFSSQVGKRLGKSDFGDAPDAQDGAQAPAKPDLKKVKADADALGYTLAKK